MAKFETSPALPIQFHGGCIRFVEPPKNSGLPRIPAIHENGNHDCVGIEKIELIATNYASAELLITLQKNPDGTSNNIISMNANFDESMSQLGWSLGLTQGVGQAILRLSKDGLVKSANHPSLYGEFNNVWVQFWTIAQSNVPQ